MKNHTLTLMINLLVVLMPVASHANPKEFECRGTATEIYASPDRTVSICHSLHTKININTLSNWHPCVDSVIHIVTKSDATEINTDCAPNAYNEFKVFSANSVFVKYYYEAYPGFEEKPLVVEEINEKTHKYTLEANLPRVTRTQLESSLSQLETELAKPFDGKTYFSAVYGTFSKILAYSVHDPEYALDVLADYERCGLFDGEVSETLSTTIGYVKLIQKTKESHLHE